jgi:F0F1-type ATP synthase delta subunit
MGLFFSQFRKNLRESAGLLDSFIYRGSYVRVFDTLDVTIDDKLIGTYADLNEARSQAEMSISSNQLLAHYTVSDEKLVSIISSTHDVKITDTMLESYKYQLNSREFSLDPVITEVRRRMSSNFADKTEYTLNDGSVVAISEETQSMLTTLLEDKYSIVKYMRVSKENFMHVVRKLGE